MKNDQTAQQIAAIYNACYLVRHYRRACAREKRASAVAQLGRAVRAAFNSTDDFEPLLTALVHGLGERDDRPAF